MARYPTYDEYKDKPEKGIKKCDELLKRQPKDINLLTTKLSLLSLLDDGQQSKPKDVITQLMACQTRHLEEINLIEEAISEHNQSTTHPQPLTSGPEVAEFWAAATKASTRVNSKTQIQTLRFSRAIFDTRLQDAQQALIQLKALQPKNRVYFMAHAIVTQMLSTEKGDLQERLALMLARLLVRGLMKRGIWIAGLRGKFLRCRIPERT
jgi:N-terminal acetyltransferase B complex non-catalytic subunit